MKAIFSTLLLLLYGKIYATSVPLQSDNNETNETLAALLDYEKGLVFYKDVSVSACLVEKIPDNLLTSLDDSEFPTFEIPIPSEELCVGRDNQVFQTDGEFLSEAGLLFCRGLPILDIRKILEKNAEKGKLERRKRQTNGYYRSGAGVPVGEARAQTNWNTPGQASQAQVQGQVFGSGFFSGQAQSQNGGASQSQVQLSGVGVRGQIASSSGNAQAQLSLGNGAGSGQAGGLGEGPSSSQVQVTLGQQGEESMASASATSGGARAEIGGVPGVGGFGGYGGGNGGQYGGLGGGGAGVRSGGPGYGFTPGTRLFDDTGAGRGAAGPYGNGHGYGGVGGNHLGGGAGQPGTVYLGYGQNGSGAVRGGQQYHGSGVTVPGGGGVRGGQQYHDGSGSITPGGGAGSGQQYHGGSGATGPGGGIRGGQQYHDGSGATLPGSGADGSGRGVSGYDAQFANGRGGGTIQRNGMSVDDTHKLGSSQVTPGTGTGLGHGSGGVHGQGLAPPGLAPGQTGSGSGYGQGQPGLQHLPGGPAIGQVGSGINGQGAYLPGAGGQYGSGVSGLHPTQNGIGATGGGTLAGPLQGYPGTAGTGTPGRSGGNLGRNGQYGVVPQSGGNGRYESPVYGHSTDGGGTAYRGGGPFAQSITPGAYASTHGMGQAQAQTVYFGNAGNGQYVPIRYDQASHPTSGSSTSPGIQRFQDQQVGVGTAGQRQLLSQNGAGNGVSHGGGTGITNGNGHQHHGLRNGYVSYGPGSPGLGATGQYPASSRPGTLPSTGTHQQPLSGIGGTGHGTSHTPVTGGGIPVDISGAYRPAYQVPSGGVPASTSGIQPQTHIPSTSLPGSIGYQNGHGQQTTSTVTTSNGRSAQTYPTNGGGYRNGGGGGYNPQQQGSTPTRNGNVYRVGDNGQPVQITSQQPRGQTGGYASSTTGEGGVAGGVAPGLDGFSPSYGISKPSQDDPDGRKCTIVTFSCTIVIESNGRAKICRPNAVTMNGNGNGGTSSPGNGNGAAGSKICCC